MQQDPTIAWLMEGDPAIRWQVRRDLLAEPLAAWSRERARVATEGWGARLLASRGADRLWGGGLYTPKWTSTTYTLLLLRRLGLPRTHQAAIESVERLMESRVWLFGPARRQYWEACVAGFGLALASGFESDRSRRDALLDEVLGAQMKDGGWNCRSFRGDTHSSFHTTINVLEGLRAHAEASERRRPDVETAEACARDFLASHQLYRSHRTGAIVDPKLTRLTLPIGWRYDILRALDYFQAAGSEPDPRLADPIAVLGDKRRPDGCWPVQGRQAGAVWFELERGAAGSRWNTLRALRVLRWWNGSG